ncbi:MAG: hypothetical protein JO272_00980 [Pseudonocardiales bacterium]|nr:hypothetical protein [Pseudonocardiales bacterium]
MAAHLGRDTDQAIVDAGEAAREVVESLLREYLGMPAAFPYLQAGAARDIAFKRIEAGEDFLSEDEVTLAVGAFLTWDETGGNYLLQEQGMAGLPEVLDTRTWFHSALLRKDIETILGHGVSASFGPSTRDYLQKLHAGLASLDAVTRVAYMASFEAHAERMIEGLWERLAELYDVDKNELVYFHAHVGGDDPAEAYHVATTAGMISRVVPQDRADDFVKQLEEAYGLHVRWCGSIVAH